MHKPTERAAKPPYLPPVPQLPELLERYTPCHSRRLSRLRSARPAEVAPGTEQPHEPPHAFEEDSNALLS